MVWWMFAVSGVLVVVFTLVELRVSQPMLDLRSFTNLSLTLNLVILAIVFFAFFGHIFLFPFYLNDMRGFDTSLVGVLLASFSLGIGLSSPIAGRLADRFRLIPATGDWVMHHPGWLCSYTDFESTNPTDCLYRNHSPIDLLNGDHHHIE